MDIQEAEIAAMGRAELEELIDRAVRPDVPLRVLFAALDRYTELLRPPVLEVEADGEEAGEVEAVVETAGVAAPGAQGAQGQGPPLDVGVAGDVGGFRSTGSAGVTGV